MTRLLVSTVLAATLLVSPAFAQSADSSAKSSEELENMFLKQKTRGLKIAPAEAEAKPAAETEVAKVEPAPDTDYVQLPEDEQVFVSIKFDFDSAALRDDQKPKLVTLCEAMKKVDVKLFRVVGHTDTSGDAAYNQRLSVLRAEEVKRHMVSSCGIAEDRLEAVGVGESYPLNQDNPRGDENRRVEFQALS
jgi:outer membrane protein OmpA-like peptidoglycan-associated protein